MPMTFVYSPCSDSTASFIEKASTSSLLSQIPILLQTGIGPDAGKKNTIKKDPGLPSRGPQIGKDYVLFIFLLLNHDIPSEQLVTQGDFAPPPRHCLEILLFVTV